jgi:hypothetical protein
VAQGLAQLVARPVAATAAPAARRAPYRETVGWLLTKHLAQLAVMAAVLTFVLVGGDNPAMALSWIAASFLFLGSVTLADRGRFLDHEPGFEVVAVHQPAVVQQPARVTLPPTAAMPLRIDVT